VPRIVECRDELGVDRLQPVPQPCAERGEPDPATGPLEQLPAGLAFKRGDNPGDPRLSQVEPLGCPAEVQLLGEGQKDLYVGGVHSPIAMRRVLPMINYPMAGCGGPAPGRRRLIRWEHRSLRTSPLIVMTSQGHRGGDARGHLAASIHRAPQ
jgi:hypothetical protein